MNINKKVFFVIVFSYICMMKEIWKDIKDFENLYQISNFGRVKSLKSNRIRKPYINNSGYFCIHLYDNKKYKIQTIHRLVAETFIPNPNNLPEINHIDGDKSNNNSNNLEFVLHNENQKHASINNLMAVGERHGRSKLKESQIIEIRKLKGTMKQKKIAEIYGVSEGIISLILNKKNWKYLY